MLTSMAVVGVTTLALLALQPDLLTRLVRTEVSVAVRHASQPATCSDQAKHAVWRSLPECQPRPTLVLLPLPQDPHILQVIPSSVEVALCAGTCHLDNQLYHHCVPMETVNTTVPVMYERLVLGQQTGVEELCATVQVETHTACRCGCPDVQCGPRQVYDSATCECKCGDQGARGQCLVQYNKVWDSQLCSCRCRPEEWRECSTGYTYDGVYSCQCLPSYNRANTPVLVTLTVLVVVLFVTTVALFVKFQRTRRKLLESNNRGQAERLFPGREM